jgi:hypothetical protein
MENFKFYKFQVCNLDFISKMQRSFICSVINFQFFCKVLKGTVSRDFSYPFFHQTTYPSPNEHAQERFRIFSKILGAVRFRNRLPGDEYTGESIKIFKGESDEKYFLVRHSAYGPKGRRYQGK